jgi:6-phosphogluconolactonase (cycloisomerase 2 family)
VPNYINIYNSNPFLNDISEVYIPGGSSNYTLTVTSTDIDGFKQYYFEEYINGTLVASYAYENATLSILNQDTLGADGQPLNTTYGSANYWGNYLDLTTYTPDDIDTTGLTYTIGEATTSGNQQSINVNFTGITSDTVGVYHLLLARYNTVTSTKTGNSYDSTAYDTQVITLTVRPDTPTLTINSGSGGLTNDSTPSIIVAGLTVGATLKILDEEDHVVATTTVTNATTQLSVTTLADGVHTLRAVQVVNDAESEEGTATVTIDTVAPQAFIDVALAAAQVNNTTTTDVYTYQIGHPEANEGTVTFSLEANHAGDVIPGDIGINIDDTTGLLTWTNPTDTYFPSVSFDIVAEDAAGNRTVEHVTLQVNSYVDISGVVYLDANDNGTADDGEEQSGVRVYADLNGNNIADENELESYSAITASNGGYELHNVPAGSVVLHQELADGYQQLSPTDTQLTLVQVIKQGDVATINDTATTVDGLTWAGALTMSPDGKYVYASSGSGGTTGLASSNSNDAIAVFERNADDGSLTYIQLIKNNVDGITGLDDPNNLVVTPDGRHVYVTCNNATTDTVVIFERDAGSGKLTQVGLLTDGGSYALNGASNVIVSEDNEFVYISAASSKAINVFSRNRFSGQLTLVQSIVNETRLAGVSQMTISPTISNYDSFLYAGSNEGMVVYKRDVVTGMLMAKQNVDGANLSGMRQIAITPDGLHLYAASYGDNALNIFQRDLSTGFLMWQDVILGQNANGATSVKINPEGTKLYFSDLYADALYVYDIASDGALSPDPLVPQTLTRNGTDPLGQTITDLDGDVAILLSPDGNDVYVASRSSNTIGVYSNRTRSWSGAALIVDATPTNDNTGQNFLNDYNAITVDSVDFNLEQFNSDRPTGKSVNAPINWTTQRSSIRDITLTFSAQLNEADTANILLQRVFDVDGNAVTDTITLSASDVTIVGNQLIISNLNLEDGVYQLTVYQTFDAALDGLYSTVFHQLLGDFNGDKAVNPADLTALLYWQQLAAGSTSYGDVPAYLDVRNASDQPIADGRVDSHDFDVITSKFGKFIPKSAIPQDPIPQIVFPSTAPGHASDTLAMAFYTSQPVSLQLIASDDEQTTTGLLDQLDNPNLILEILESQ